MFERLLTVLVNMTGNSMSRKSVTSLKTYILCTWLINFKIMKLIYEKGHKIALKSPDFQINQGSKV